MLDNGQPEVLVIDDEPIIRESFKLYLEKFDYRTQTAENGIKGVQYFINHHVDLVLVDLRMPAMDGLQVLAKIRELDPNMPVIVISGTEDVRDVAEALRQGAWDYLHKPIVDMSILLHAIEKGLERSRLKRENLSYQQELEQKVKLKTREIDLVNKRLKEVVESSKRLLGCGELHESGKVILEEFGHHMNARGGSMYRVSEEGLYLLHSIDRGHAVPFLPFPLRDGSPFLKVLKSTDPFYMVDIKNDESLKPSGWDRYTDNSALFFPIIDRLQCTIAIITIYNKEVPPFLSQDMEIGAVLSSYAGEILQTAQVESELRRSEEHLLQSQKMEAVGTLAGGIAHDFNNILSAIIGYTDLSLFSETIDPGIRRNLEQIQKAGKRARDLVKQILSFSRTAEFQEVAVDIGPVVHEVLKLLRAIIPTSILITQEISNDIGKIVIDPGRIHQILMNLCTNAAQAMSEKGGEICVRCTRIEKNNYPHDLTEINNESCLCVSVEDNGCGIDLSLLSRIFDPYFTTKEKEEGTGLGLAVVHGIVTKSGGVIKVTSTIGEGSVFRLYFPFVSENKETAEYRSSMNMPVGNENILFVDDEVTLGEVAGEMLTKLGYNVEVQTSSVAALKSIRLEPMKYDLLITDQTMPVLTGVELTREALDLKPDLPVILYTGYSTAIDGDEARKIGICEFLMKPISMEKLAVVIRRVLDRHKNNGA